MVKVIERKNKISDDNKWRLSFIPTIIAAAFVILQYFSSQDLGINDLENQSRESSKDIVEWKANTIENSRRINNHALLDAERNSLVLVAKSERVALMNQLRELNDNVKALSKKLDK